MLNNAFVPVAGLAELSQVLFLPKNNLPLSKSNAHCQISPVVPVPKSVNAVSVPL